MNAIMQRRERLKRRFWKVSWGRLYWNKSNRRRRGMFSEGDVCVVVDGAAKIHYKSLDEFIKDIEYAEDLAFYNSEPK